MSHASATLWLPESFERAASQPARRGGRLRASYDAAQTNHENEAHWRLADSLSARAAHNPAVRRILRQRARYEVANSPLARGILKKLANFVVGTGPRLQLATKDKAFNRAVARRWTQWSVAVRLAAKLWLMRKSKAESGECFALLTTNHGLRHPVKLDLRCIEADQVMDPRLLAETQRASDGIVYDDFGNPLSYKILRQHPGDMIFPGISPLEADDYPASQVLHYFTAERPGQLRGVPEITAALPLFAMRRRFLLSVLAAAETAADIAGVLKTQGVPEASDNEKLCEPLDVFEVERRMLMTLPDGYDLQQFRAEQPQTTLAMFDRVLVSEMGRCFNMPYAIAAADSSEYNFASGKLDHLTWWDEIRIEQDELDDQVVDRTFAAWWAEAVRIPGYLPPLPASAGGDGASLWDKNEPPPHSWFFDGQDLLDPREAGAKQTALSAGFATHARLFAKQGLDIEEEWQAEADLLGITLDEYRQLVRDSVFKKSAVPAGDDEQEETDDTPQVRRNG